MFQWIFIGLVIWFFYNRFSKKSLRSQQNGRRFIRDDEFIPPRRPDEVQQVDEDDYIDYEEIK